MDKLKVLIHSMTKGNPHMYPCNNNPENFSVRYARTCMRAAASFGGLIGGEPLTMSLWMTLPAGMPAVVLVQRSPPVESFPSL